MDRELLAERDELVASLLRWFHAEKRDMPWRRTRDPYAIWVSEIMLQQTRVETVKPYYGRFLESFPTVRALADAPLDAVLARWSGLGYYARARSLHKAAQAVRERHGGALPASAAALAELPGFGPYTTASVGSIAFGLPLACVDGNVARVLARWTCTEGDPREPKAMERYRVLAQSLVPAEAPGAFNEAMMELGATLCVPGEPACLVCPVARHCRARAAGRQQELPARRAAKERAKLRLVAAHVTRGDTVLLARRPDEGLFASLWELPSAELPANGEGGADPGSEADALAAALSERLGVRATVEEPLARVAQTLTHRELEVSIWRVSLPPRAKVRARSFYVDAAFATLDAVPGGLASATRKALAAVAKARRHL